MNSTLYLFKGTKILPERMFKVDNIENYLQSIGGTNIFIRTNFQYVKHALNLTIKVDMTQEALDFRNRPNSTLLAFWDNINYCSIQNSGGRVVYYFVIDKKWIAEQTIQFVLKMDTLNTFVGSTDLQLSDKTKIIRQHKDRWVKDGAKIWPVIDLYSEGINPQLYGGNEITLNESSDWGNQSWYLVYRNQNEPSESLVNPVNCFLVPETDFYIDSFSVLHVDINAYNWQQAFIDYPDGAFLRRFDIIGKFNRFIQIVLKAKDGTNLGTIALAENRMISIQRENINLPYKIFLMNAETGAKIGSGWELSTEDGQPTKVYLMEITNLLVIKTTNQKALVDVPATDLYYEANASVPVYYNYTSTATTTATDFIYISPLSAIDKTRAELIKIIEIPYTPQAFYTTNDGSNSVKTFGLTDANWGTAWISGMGGVIILYYLGLDLERRLEFLSGSNDNPFKPLDRFLWTDIDFNSNKSADNEPKLYHSDYYQPKIYYDSFGFIINLEKITQYQNTAYDLWNSLRLDYRCTSTINSRFAFKVVDYVCNGLETQDYNNVFVIARNNEIPIYNQQYINYLRSGINYDVKSKTRTEVGVWAGVGLSAIGTIASFVAGGPIGVVAGVGMATATAGQLINAVNTTMQAEQNIEAKQKQLQMQATSVYGSDDVDLMEFYAGNRLRLKTYKVSERMKKSLFDLFFYCGYTHNILGIPNTTSRTRFNFVQAEPIFKQTPNLPKEIVDDIIANYRAGFTYLHRFNNEWDWEQEKENWETSLLIQ